MQELKLRKKRSVVIRVGEKYSRLLIVSEIEPLSGHRRVLCRCDCGNMHEVGLAHLRSGKIKSCGCLFLGHARNQPTRERSPSWRGGRRIDDGYVLIYMPEHPRSKKNGYVREHTVIMENKLGRYLLPQENVHHIDGNKTNNNPDNLELWSTSQPSGQRVADKLEWARKIIKLYE